MNDIRQFWVTLVGGLAAIIIGVLGVAGDPPVLALGDTLSVALIIAGLAVLGVGPIKSAYGAARASSASK
jgi:hypothetical protein